MLFTEYIIALVKVLFNMAFCIVTSVPAVICWNCIARNYLAEWLPDRFENVGFWHMVAFLFVLHTINEYTPSLVKVSQSNTASTK